MRALTISVVVPVLNGGEMIFDLLESLVAQVELPDEVLVVDNGSRDGTLERVSAWAKANPCLPITLLQELSPGPACARNRGCQVAQGEYLAFFDHDCIVNPEWIAKAKRIAEQSGAEVVGGVVRAAQATTFSEIVAAIRHCPKKLEGHDFVRAGRWEVTSDAFETNNVLVKRSAFAEIGGFNTQDFPFVGEDFDLFMRLATQGRLLLARHHQLRVLHQHRSNFRALMKQTFSYASGYTRVILRHFPRLLVVKTPFGFFSRPFPICFWCLLSPLLIPPFALLLALVFFPFWVAALIGLIGFLGLLRHFGILCRKESLKVSPGGLVAVTVIILLHRLAWELGLLRGSLSNRVIVV